MPPTEPEDPTPEAPQDEAEAALRDAIPSWMKDGQGLRGPNPRVGKDPGADGASGNEGDMSINQGGRGSADDAPPKNDDQGGKFKLLKDFVYYDIANDELMQTNVWTDGRLDTFP